jgi:hypothetical protein
MKCGRCGNENSNTARFCAKCGTSLSSGSVLSRLNPDLEGTRRQVREHLEATKASINAQIAQYSSPLRVTAKPAAPAGSRSLIHPMELLSLLLPLPDQITQSKNIALSSPFIQSNALYRTRIAGVSFAFLQEDTTVNAYATDFPHDLPDGGKLEPPAIVFLNGLASALRLMAAAVAVSMRPGEGVPSTGESALGRTFRAMGSCLVQSGGKFDIEMLGMIFEQAILSEIVEGKDRFVSLARSLSASMEAAVIAHEAGHIALSHTLGMALNFDVSRNQEREADSFASSVLSTSPFREYLFLGQVFVTLLFSWMDHVARSKNPTTHPLGRERFFNVMTNNSAAAADAADQFGLTRERLVELLPPEDAQTVAMRFLQVPGAR